MKNQVVIAYHGGPVPIRKFSPEHGAQGLMWFSEDRAKIERGDSGAGSTRYIMTVKLKVKNVAGWPEYDQLMLAQIFSKTYGFDAIRLDHGEDGADWALRDPRRVEVVAIEERPPGGWPAAKGRASGRARGRAGGRAEDEEDLSGLHPALAALVSDRYPVAARGLHGEFWVVLNTPKGKYLAAWIDEEGSLHKTERAYLKAATKLAKDSWGR